MRLSVVRPLSLIAIAGFSCGSLFSQIVIKRLGALSKPEPGLERAVNWKWWVALPEEKEWGMPLPDALMPKTPGSTALDLALHPPQRPETYEVKKGDAIIKIARKFEMSAAQLMQFNELSGDRIVIGQVLRIPTPGDLLTMIPPPKAIVVEEKKEKKEKKKPGREPVIDPYSDFEFVSEEQEELENVRMQVFLDREMFSPGMIDGKSGALTKQIREVYQKSHVDAANPGMLQAKVEAALKEPYTRYILRVDDFKFIKLPKDEPVVARGGASPAPRKKDSKAAPTPAPAPPPLTIDELVAEDFLGYTSVWELVAERFHCDEEFLHHINPQIKGSPAVGSEFQVPNVIPFEIEKALDLPLQPAADPQKQVTAAVVALTRLEISCDGKLIAVMPLAVARPGLHGRDKWTVLDAIPRPRLATKREPRVPPKEKPATAGDGVPVVEAPPETEQHLTCGPNNPVGIIWIDLAKGGSTDPLPYGLHGTSIPAQMGLQQGLGGLRLTNWDIARAVRLMPAGTALQWKAQ